MNIEQIRSGRDYVASELRSIHEAAAGRDLNTDEQVRYDEGLAFVDAADKSIERHNSLVRLGSAPAAESGHDSDPVGEPESIRNASAIKNPWDLDVVRTATRPELAARAVTVAEKAQGLTDRQRETLTTIVEQFASDEDSAGSERALRHIIATSSPDYLRSWSRAFRAAIRGGQADTSTLERAASLTDAAGGYAVPQQLDPTLILTSDGSVNPFRQIARKVVATGDVWTGLSTTHASWSWDAEAAEASDDATTFAQPSITVYKAVGNIPFSIEIGQDYPNFTSDLQMVLAKGKDDLEATAFATGSGSAPQGIVTALTGGSSVVASAGADTFAVADLYNLEEALPAKYRARAQFTANKAIYNDVRQFGTSDSHALWERVGAGQPAELLGYAAHESSAMDGTITAAAENYVLILGDWDNYVIADRIGFSMELVPHLFHTGNNRPSGQRSFFAYYRVGADSVNDGGFRMLNVT